MKVTITSEDFATSNYESNTNCALAKALKRKFPTKCIVVGGMSVDIDDNTYLIENQYENDTNLIDHRCGLMNQKPLTVTLDLIK